MMTRTPLIFTLFIAMASVGCDKPLKLSSKWCDREIKIDGKNLEWEGGTTYIEDANAAVGLFNDENYLYIHFFSRDEAIKTQVMRDGLTIWFDPRGGEGKMFGIRYPIGMVEKDRPAMTQDDREESMGIKNMEGKILEPYLKEMEILAGIKEETYSTSPSDAETLGINVKIGDFMGTFVYELKVPLSQNEHQPFAIGLNTSETDTSRTISIGFETPEFDMEEMKKHMGEKGMGMPPGGGMSPGGSGMPQGVCLVVECLVADGQVEAERSPNVYSCGCP
jgi:hypothetical protein